MARFTFSKKFGATPSSEDYNDIKDDFLAYINSTKLDQDNLQDESIRFRHLKKAPVLLLWKDCGNDIWNADNAALRGIGTEPVSPLEASPYGSVEMEWELYRDTNLVASNTLQLEYSVDEDSPNVNLVEFSFYYYPYSISANSQVAPAIFRDGAWVPLVEHRRFAGIAVGHYVSKDMLPLHAGGTIGTTDVPILKPHPFILDFNLGEPSWEPTEYISTGNGEYDRLGTTAYGGPIMCTVLFKREDLAGVTRFGMMIKQDLSHDEDDTVEIGEGATFTYRFRTNCCVHDRLFMWLVARDN